MATTNMTRRSVLKTAALATTVLSVPFVRGARAAGSPSIGLRDYLVPGADAHSTKLGQEWGEKNKVEVTIDDITSQGDKLTLTKAAEGRPARA